MSVYRSMGRGTWIVERTLLGVLVRRATGLYDYDRASEVERTLLKLAQHGRRDLIEAFDAGHIAGAELVSAVECFGVSFQLTVERALELGPAVERWLDEADLVESTKRDYRNGLAALQRRARKARVGDLPSLLLRYARRAKPVMFQRVKAAAMSFVRSTIPKGQQSDLWRDIAAIRGPKTTRRQVQGGLPPAVARQIAEKLGRFGPMWWTLCCTGMGPREYWVSPWKVAAGYIEIAGTKRERRHRRVPVVALPVRPLCGPRLFSQALAAVGRELLIPKLTMYVARRTYAHWLELARIPDSRCDRYMGHAPKDVRAGYREHEALAYMAEDAKALRSVIGGDPRYLQAVAG